MDQELTRLRALDELDQVLTDSHAQPLLLFKHSHTCGISAEALDELLVHIGDRTPATVKYAMVTVQTHRELSNEIAKRLGVRHETPQAILVKGGQVLWSASHFRVNAAELSKALSAHS